MNYISLLAAILGMVLFTGCEDTIESPLAGTLSGRVLDQENQKPLKGIRISTNPYSDIAETDTLGRFTIDDIEAGEYNVIASKTGYKSESISITIYFHETTTVEMELAESISEDNSPVFTDLFSPVDQEKIKKLEVLFTWQIEENDSVSYDLILFENATIDDPMVYESIKDTFCVVEGLKFSTNYLWQLVAHKDTVEVYSPVHRFSTTSFPYNQIMYSQMEDEILQLFVADTALETVAQITFDNHNTWNARMNYQRSAIAFQSTRNVETHLYLMDLDGSNIKRLTSFQVGGYFHQKIEYDWAPNGSHLIFTSYENLYRIDKDGTGLQVIATAPDNKQFREVIYSPDGEAIYAIVLGSNVLDRQIYRMDKDGNNMTLLYEDPGYALAHLSMSPDLKSLLFSKDMSGYVSTSGRLLDAHIFELTIADGTVEDLSEGKDAGTNDLYAFYSPDGGGIVFINSRNTLTAVPNVYIMGVDGNKREQLVEGAYTPSWFE
jgi:TolB protein